MAIEKHLCQSEFQFHKGTIKTYTIIGIATLAGIISIP